MRTVRSAARARNRTPGRAAALAWLVLAIFVALAVLAARAETAPYVPGDTGDGAFEAWDGEPGAGDDLAIADEDLGAPPSAGLPQATAAELAAVRAPASARVVAAAYRAAGLADDPAPGWRHRSRLAGLVPMVTVRDGKDSAWKDVSDPTIAYVSVFSVGATWHLERLLFDPSELRIAGIEAGRRRDRRRVGTVVIRTYFAWLRLHAASARDPRWALRAAETAAELDVLTGGWFSQNLPPPPFASHNLGT